MAISQFARLGYRTLRYDVGKVLTALTRNEVKAIGMNSNDLENFSGKVTDKTIAPVRGPSHLNPEFVDCKGLETGWGIKRSLAYQLLHDGKIRGVSLRRRGAVRGKGLFSVDSIRAFLREQMKQAS